jgi:hypothetical protein
MDHPVFTFSVLKPGDTYYPRRNFSQLWQLLPVVSSVRLSNCFFPKTRKSHTALVTILRPAGFGRNDRVLRMMRCPWARLIGMSFALGLAQFTSAHHARPKRTRTPELVSLGLT